MMLLLIDCFLVVFINDFVDKYLPVVQGISCTIGMT